MDYLEISISQKDWCSKNGMVVYTEVIKVWTFREAHKFWKNLPRGFDVYLVNQLICQNHEKDFFQILSASQKIWTLQKSFTILKKASQSWEIRMFRKKVKRGISQNWCKKCDDFSISSRSHWHIIFGSSTRHHPVFYHVIFYINSEKSGCLENRKTIRHVKILADDVS